MSLCNARRGKKAQCSVADAGLQCSGLIPRMSHTPFSVPLAS